jgi:arsenate reductase
MAHGFLKAIDHRLEVASAGTEASGRLNPKAVAVMKDIGIDISHHTSDPVDIYLDDVWDYVITVCDGANEACPVFTGKVKKRLHIGFEDPSHVTGTEDFIHSEYIRVRDEIREAFQKLYTEEIKAKL